jgi:hypothetical protein
MSLETPVHMTIVRSLVGVSLAVTLAISVQASLAFADLKPSPTTASSAAPTSVFAPVTSATIPIRASRLSVSLRRPDQVFLPPRLVIGTSNELVVRGTPGSKVILLYASAAAETPATLPNGQTVAVPLDSPRIETTLNDKGVATLLFPVPNDKTLVGRQVVVAVLGYSAPDKSDVHTVQLMDSTGRATTDNRLSLAATATESLSNRPTVLPVMPGMDPALVRQVQTVSELSTNKEKRERLYDEGTINRGTSLGKNSLYNAPGAAGYSIGGQQ